MNNERSPLLELGLILSGLHAIFWIGIAFFGALIVGLGIGAAGLLDPAAMLPAGMAGGFIGLAIGMYVSWCLLTLCACVGTWRGSRAWMWTLFVLSLLGLTDFGLLSTPARLLTVIGILQVASQRDGLGDGSGDELGAS